MTTIPILVAFTAGIVSFLAPCVLPLIPGYLAYLAGVKVGEGGRGRREIFINSVFFVTGFSLVFALLGVLLNTLLSSIAYDAQIWLSRIGGLIIIGFGIYLTGLIKLSFLEREYRLAPKYKFSSQYATSVLFGAAFAAGWSPCVGAVLGAVLGLAASQPGIAFFLLLSYAAGFSVPLLIVGLFSGQAVTLINKYGSAANIVNKVFGALLVVLGILIFTQNLARFANLELLNRLFL
jgi:cytochrome c-type biogenesis protein